MSTDFADWYRIISRIYQRQHPWFTSKSLTVDMTLRHINPCYSNPICYNNVTKALQGPCQIKRLIHTLPRGNRDYHIWPLKVFGLEIRPKYVRTPIFIKIDPYIGARVTDIAPKTKLFIPHEKDISI